MSTEPFPRSVQLALESAIGWVELGNSGEAGKVLEEIPDEFRLCPEFLRVRYAIHAAEGNWVAAEEIAFSIAELQPDDSWGLRHQAAALHEQKLTNEAWDVLFPALDRFKEWQMCYDLARYAVRLGKLTEAFTLLAEATRLNRTGRLKQRALDDPDFQPLWLNLSGV